MCAHEFTRQEFRISKIHGITNLQLQKERDVECQVFMELTILEAKHAPILHRQPPNITIDTFKQHSDPPVGIAPILWLELLHDFFEFIDFVILVVVLDLIPSVVLILLLRLRCIISGCKNEMYRPCSKN